MKIKEGYMLDMIGDQKVAISLNSAHDQFNGMIKLNEAGAFLWEQLSTDTSEETLISELMDEYQVDEETAQRDVRAFVKTLQSRGILE